MIIIKLFADIYLYEFCFFIFIYFISMNYLFSKINYVFKILFFFKFEKCFQVLLKFHGQRLALQLVSYNISFTYFFLFQSSGTCGGAVPTIPSIKVDFCKHHLLKGLYTPVCRVHQPLIQSRFSHVFVVYSETIEIVQR